jgi:hypothetical protein
MSQSESTIHSVGVLGIDTTTGGKLGLGPKKNLLSAPNIEKLPRPFHWQR